MMIEADSYDPLLFFYLDSVFMFRELLSGRVLLLVKYQEKGMIRMPRKRRSTKSRIVKAAWNLFYKNGYEQTTVEDIINAAKTSKGTFYHYFKGKEALLNSLSYLFDQKYEDLAAVIDPNLSSYDKLLFLNHELFYMIETSVDIHLLAYLYSSAIDHQRQEIPFRQETDLFQMAYRNYGRGACQRRIQKYKHRR